MSADLIIVLGNAIHDSQTRHDAELRASHAADLFHRGLAPHIICTGGYTHRQKQSEASFLAERLMQNGVPQTAITLEESSSTTVGNARHCRAIVEARNAQSIVVVTSLYHVPRAELIFRAVYPDRTITFDGCRGGLGWRRRLVYGPIGWWHYLKIRRFGLVKERS